MQNHKHKVLAIGGTDDHIHIFFSYNHSELIQTIVRYVKRDSSLWIKENRLAPCRFGWQEGYGAFSYSKSQVNHVVKHILTKEKAHENKSSLDEYKELLEKYNVEYNEKYLQ